MNYKHRFFRYASGQIYRNRERHCDCNTMHPVRDKVIKSRKQPTGKSRHPTRVQISPMANSPYLTVQLSTCITKRNWTHCHVGTSTNERVDIWLHRADKSATHAKVTQFYLTARIHQNIWWFYICTITAASACHTCSPTSAFIMDAVDFKHLINLLINIFNH